MLNKYLLKRLASSIILPIFLTACNSGTSNDTPVANLNLSNSTVPTTLPDGSALNEGLQQFASKIQGTWKATDCSKQEEATYYGKVQFTISGWSIVLTNTYFNDSQCTQNEIGKLVRTASITDLSKSSSTLYSLIVVVEKTDMTPSTSVVASDWSARSACGLTGWNEGVARTLQASYLCQYGPTVMDSIGSGTGNFSIGFETDFTSEPNTLNSQGKTLVRE